jgi:hypothetical protein
MTDVGKCKRQKSQLLIFERGMMECHHHISQAIFYLLFPNLRHATGNAVMSVYFCDEQGRLWTIVTVACIGKTECFATNKHVQYW